MRNIDIALGEMSSLGGALPYHEPTIVTILILSAFLLLANVISYVFDRILYCGLIGQILIGVAFGTPGANWLALDVQNTMQQLGYIGLILIVFEGGLSTNLKMLKSNLFLSSIVALIGTGTSIALSFTLQGLVHMTPLQSFAAGAALCSTSLGTTFTILTTSGLSQSRLGVVLTSAAMMDDIVGLVMSGIISNLGQSSSASAAQVLRPVLVSVAFAVVFPLSCRWMVEPMTRSLYDSFSEPRNETLKQMIKSGHATLIVQTGVLLVLVTGSSYAGTSNLFAAYIAGACITWWDGFVEDIWKNKETRRRSDAASQGPETVSMQADPVTARSQPSDESPQEIPGEGGTRSDEPSPSNLATLNGTPDLNSNVSTSSGGSGVVVFEKHYQAVLNTVLKPFFFASIGFAIPISRMFSAGALWRGVVYALLMTVAKLVCGLCLVRFERPEFPTRSLARLLPRSIKGCWPMSPSKAKVVSTAAVTSNCQQTGTTHPPVEAQVSAESSQAVPQERKKSRKFSRIRKPLSLYPAAMLGSAMVARGEIGFLISSVAESGGLFRDLDAKQTADPYIVVTWAILLCTIIGPVSVGLLAKRVKRLQDTERGKQSSKADPLDIWGIRTAS